MRINRTFFSLATLAVCAGTHADSAYDFGTVLTLETVNSFHGGLKTGSSELANLDATLSINTDTAGWWSNGEFFIYALGDTGKNPSEKTGDLQGISNIATDAAAKIYELWYQHSFAEGKLKVLFGLHDYNSTFYTLDSAGLFSHPSFGIGPDTSQVGPSIFSTTATALLVSFDDEHHYLLTAVYDGIPGDPENPRGTHIRFDNSDGVFTSAEMGFKEKDNYKVGLGLWQHTAKVENPIDHTIDHRNNGLYLIGEKSIRENQSLFIQLGHADDNSNQLAYYLGVGMTAKNMFKAEDALGFGVAHARNGRSFLAENPELDAAETTCELTYFLPLVEHVSFQTSLYYVKNPSMDKSLDDAIAIGARAYFEL